MLKILHFNNLGRLTVQETFVLNGLILSLNHEMCRFTDNNRMERVKKSFQTVTAKFKDPI